MNKDKFRTNTLSLAAALVCTNSKSLSGVEFSDTSNKATFLFTNNSDLLHAARLFFEKKLDVDALSYFEAIKYLKSRVFEGKGGDYRNA